MRLHRLACFSAGVALAAAVAGDAAALSRGDVDSPAACAPDAAVAALDAAARVNERATPRAAAQPVLVDVGVFVEQLDAIVEAEHSFQVEAFLEYVWCDPRLAFLPEEAATDRKVFLEDEAHDRLGEIWWPDIAIENAIGPVAVEREELLIFADGTVVYEERVSAVLRTRFDFTQFPFDRQRLPILLESFAWSAAFVTLHEDERILGFADQFDIPSWTVVGMDAEVIEKKEVRDRDPFSEMIATLEVERVSAPLVYRLILPLLLIVAVSWSVFWLRPTSTGRFGVTFTTILTVVAFNLIVSQRLPNEPQVTFTEAVFGFAFLSLLLVVVVNTLIDRATAKGDVGRAVLIDRYARVLFPSVFVAGLAACVVAFELV